MFAVLGSPTSLSFPHTEVWFYLGQIVGREYLYFIWLFLYPAGSTPLLVKTLHLWASVS